MGISIDGKYSRFALLIWKKTPLFSLIHILKLNIQLRWLFNFFFDFKIYFFIVQGCFLNFCIFQIKHTTFMIYTNMYLFSIGIQSIIQKYIHEKYRFDIIHKMIFFKKKITSTSKNTFTLTIHTETTIRSLMSRYIKYTNI